MPFANVVSFPDAGRDLPFHPLADLFPLIEGPEFDELVASIKEVGQLEPIILLDGAILDGRNRYRACKAAGVAPRTETFPGGDPARFVFSKNIMRRHLTASQRAIAVAEFARLQHGSNQHVKRDQVEDVEISTSMVLTVREAVELGGVDRSTVLYARKVLAEGTEDEIAAVKSGAAAVSTIARAISKSKCPEERKQALARARADQNTGRIKTAQLHADIWAKLRSGLEGLTGLPLAADVAAIVRGHPNRRRTTDAKLEPALDWLMEFSDAWNAQRDH